MTPSAVVCRAFRQFARRFSPHTGPCAERAFTRLGVAVSLRWGQARRRCAARRPGRGSSRCRRPPRWRPAARKSAASRPDAIPPIPTTGIPTRARHRGDLLQGDRPHRGAREAAGAAAQPRLARPRVERHALERVEQRDGVAPRPPRRPRPPPPGRWRWGSASRSAASRSAARTAPPRAAVSAGSAPMIRPLSTLGQETLSSISATSSRSADRARPARPGRRGE